MSKLDDLIAELCPDGVDYQPLSKLTTAINIGINPRKFFKLNPDDAEGFYVTVRELNGLQGVLEYDKTDKINLQAVCQNAYPQCQNTAVFKRTCTCKKSIRYIAHSICKNRFIRKPETKTPYSVGKIVHRDTPLGKL